MSSRQDKLVLLIDTGTTTQVRQTAARQFVDLVHKTYTFALTPIKVEGDAPQSAVSETEAWTEVLESISKLLPLLQSKSSESRSASAFALGLLAKTLPAYAGPTQETSELSVDAIILPELLKDSPLLLASAGREYAGKSNGKGKQAFLKSLGLEDQLMGDNAADMLDEGDAIEEAAPPPDIFEGLSARQITMLKRKKGNIIDEANKLRKLNVSATPTPRGSPEKSATPLPATNKVEPVSVSAAKIVSIEAGHSPWTSVFFEIVPHLASPSWHARHGSALAIMEILSSVRSRHAMQIARHLLALLALDRFGDFLGDIVMAPVREVSAQALGICIKQLGTSDIHEIHQIMLSMIHQPWARRDGEKWEKFSWELRHAGLLGLKYEVVVRSDLEGILPGVLEAVIKRQVLRKSTLMTVCATLTMMLCTLPDLPTLLNTLWTCLDSGDDLGSSVGAVMDLLGALIAQPAVIDLIEQTPNKLLLISRIYPFLRHPIISVRRSVVQVLCRFVTAPGLERSDWMHDTFFSLMFENIILDTLYDIRETSWKAFDAGLREVESRSGEVSTVTEGSIEDWYALVMTPVGHALDPKAFMRIPKKRAGHDIDKPIMQGDLGLVASETVWATKIKAAGALASLKQYLQDDDQYLISALQSGCAHAVIVSCIIIQEWAYSSTHRLGVGRAAALVPLLTSFIESPAPASYTELESVHDRLAADTRALLSSFTEAKVPKASIPAIKHFSIGTAQHALSVQFDALLKLVPKAGIKAVAGIQDRKSRLYASIGYYTVTKERLDAQVGAAVASALLAIQTVPDKHGPLVRAIMNAIKTEESEVLQKRAARGVSDFIAFVQSPHWNKPINAPDKVIQNLFTYIHSDPTICPVFSPLEDGILSLGDSTVVPDLKKQITRRGALFAFEAMASSFGAKLWDAVPQVWTGLSKALLVDSPSGQSVIDALVSIRFIAPHLSPDLMPRLLNLLPAIIAAIDSDVALVRHQGAQCIAALCDIMTDAAMRFVIDKVVPLVGDAKRLHARQGSLEALHHIIRSLDLRILPYVLFLIVPILGRMSDPDEHIRLLSTSTFASLIKMVPLEAGLPDPPGFSAELLGKRDEERQFLMQLLDGRKAEQYRIPIEIKADLRQYQKDGVSWLAFLAKYQLHGILCDDMGLGKSLQTICIIGSKHHERIRLRSAHLPSLIVCPPTLTGHWHHEISKFTSDLSAIQYVGNASQRSHLHSRLQQHDVVIASYETVRADIDILSRFDWLYCVLDEGHIIKNAKTKLAAAVKQIKAQHRLLLSGTPIQNNLLELWSLFDFLMPGFLGTERHFQEKFSKPVMADRDGKAGAKEREAAANALEALHKQVLPFLLRRLKEDVLQDLPPKIIQDYHCELSPLQAVLYDEFQKSRAAEEAGQEVQGAEGQGHVFQSLQYLRKLCNHPALVMDGAKQIDDIKRRAGLSKEIGLRDIANAPKLLALKQLLNDCGIGLGKEENAGHRVLIFCQMRPMLDLIETTLFAQHMPTVTYMRMDGSVDPKKRHAIVQTYNADPRIDVLLLTTSVGGLGLNLTSADTVIFVDHDWNPMKDLQAMDRAHRLGQRKVVNVYRLITKGTLEEKIMGLQRFKLNIASSVVTQQNAGLGSMNTSDVLDLFKVDGESKPKKEATGPLSASKVLEGLDDLPPEDEYADLSLDNFLSRV